MQKALLSDKNNNVSLLRSSKHVINHYSTKMSPLCGF